MRVDGVSGCRVILNDLSEGSLQGGSTTRDEGARLLIHPGVIDDDNRVKSVTLTGSSLNPELIPSDTFLGLSVLPVLYSHVRVCVFVCVRASTTVRRLTLLSD